MKPSRQRPSRHHRVAGEQVLVTDGGRRDTDEGEDWRWDPSVDEEPVIEPDESGEETHADRSSDGTPSGQDSPAGGQGRQPGSGAPPTRGPDADHPDDHRLTAPEAEAACSLPEPLQRAGMAAFEGEIGVHMDRPTSLFSREQLAALLR